MSDTTPTTPTTYQLTHPELDVPAMAEFIRYWRQNGRDIGLVLRFEGESLERHLTYGELAELQEEEEE